MRQDPSPVIPAKAGIQDLVVPPVPAIRYSAHAEAHCALIHQSV